MEKLSVYKCLKCGNIVEVLHVGGGTLTCCGEAMKEMKANTTDGTTEKHVPVIDGGKVKVGSAVHPMEQEHYIEWIEIINGERVCRKFLKPGEAPEADFGTIAPESTAREYCNKHGLWKSKN